MSSWSFSIGLNIELNDANILLQEYKSNELYQCAFHYGIAAEGLNNEFNAEITSVIDNFLPANNLIFKFLSTIASPKGKIGIKTREIQRSFDFESKSDFINFMYNVWEDKIDATYKQFGVIMLNQKNYYKTRNKLFKKYYKNF